MFRRAILSIASLCLLFSVYALAQDTSSSKSNSGTPDAAQSQSSDTQTQPSDAQSQPADGQSQPADAQSQPANPPVPPSDVQVMDSKTDTKASPLPPSKHTGKKSKKSKKDKVANPIANLDSKQPDKALYDRAMDAINHSKYDVARLSLQTLINTYPDSEYVARAKLAIGDAWYAEGGTVALSQAESEYKDFITFFPNMPEAAEAQMKIGNIHFKEMEKADRDPTHARRAEEEYRQMILNFPDSPLVPQAKERLLEVQEVLARREYMIGHFYYLRENWPAAMARMKSLADTYPLYSGADEALFELGGCYEGEVELIRRSRLPEATKGTEMKKYEGLAEAAYDRILTQYPLESRAPDAKKRLEALKKPVPNATPEAVAADKAQIASRGNMGTMGKIMENFHKGPDVSEATHVGEPTLVDPKQASAPDIVRAASAELITDLQGGGHQVSVEKTGTDTPPAANAPTPHSDATPGTDATGDAGTPAGSNNAQPAGTEMRNDLAPAGSAAPAPPLPPTQVNDIAGTSSSSGSHASAGASQAQAAPANPDTESSSKKKKKKHLLLF